MARPVWRTEFQNRSASGIDIMIAFDVSLSMEIDDFTNNAGQPLQRLDAAKAVVTNFVKNRPARHGHPLKRHRIPQSPGRPPVRAGTLRQPAGECRG
jgi:hypothetical protein